MSNYIIQPLTENDLHKIATLQPEDWSDITLSIKFYIESDFCFPIKVAANSRLVGIGTSILFEDTSWLAHIIVQKNYRHKGIGSKIVDHLIKYVTQRGLKTILLIATKLGEPIYKKAGFNNVTDYIFLTKDSEFPNYKRDQNIIPYSENWKDEILSLDKKIMGEERGSVITEYLNDSFLYVQNNKLFGYYLTKFGEGSIVAVSDKAGLELLKIKAVNNKKVVIPKENLTAYNFLIDNGFKEKSRCARMVYGKPIAWHPENYYSRMGGNFG